VDKLGGIVSSDAMMLLRASFDAPKLQVFFVKIVFLEKGMTEQDLN